MWIVRSIFICKCRENSNNIPDTIFPEEVTLRLQKMKIHTSAGPDGIQVSHLRTCDRVCLAKSFNCFLLAGHIPQQLEDCRTTIIPKTDDPLPDAEDLPANHHRFMCIPALQQNCNEAAR
ncbi:Retrovirus-related Pol polyprotein from type-2 retrotransposable element R2DM [Trichinella spiralis]|uniref:Uncharacterized protein n=2 Tax=Trichinella spiralis TaxID=6334 RepID=A0A0V1ATS2_TRISP|nr:hypothetical protein T01_10146 [Trichinella spiralis]